MVLRDTFEGEAGGTMEAAEEEWALDAAGVLNTFPMLPNELLAAEADDDIVPASSMLASKRDREAAQQWL